MPLSVRIKKRLKNFFLDVEFEAENEILGLLGASGCGKSMTLKCIAGIETPDEGRIILDGRTLFDSEKRINVPPQKRKIGYLFQSYALFPNMTVEENIASGINGKKSERMDAVRRKISEFYLDGLEKKMPSQLSGGQQQRVALARLLASEPELIMFDEPFSALDSHLRWKLEMEVASVLSRFGGTSIIVSHNRDELYRLCGNIAVISDGRVDVLSEKHEIFKNPKTLNAAILSGCKNVSRAERVSEYSVMAIDWGIQLVSEAPVSEDIEYVGIRAHYLERAGADCENAFSYNVVSATESSFSYILMLRSTGCTERTDMSDIRWEIDKSLWEGIQGCGTLSVAIPKNKLLLLKG